jgi:hypothetical protein
MGKHLSYSDTALVNMVRSDSFFSLSPASNHRFHLPFENLSLLQCSILPFKTRITNYDLFKLVIKIIF